MNGHSAQRLHSQGLGARALADLRLTSAKGHVHVLPTSGATTLHATLCEALQWNRSACGVPPRGCNAARHVWVHWLGIYMDGADMWQA